jgi:hypothetical protein
MTTLVIGHLSLVIEIVALSDKRRNFSALVGCGIMRGCNNSPEADQE